MERPVLRAALSAVPRGGPDLSPLATFIRERAAWFARWTDGALERWDLEAEGWLAALCLLERRPDARQPLIARRVDGAMRDALRREWRARGRVRAGIRWPVFWPQCVGTRAWQPFRLRRCQACGTPELAANAKRCPPCAAHHRLLAQRGYNRDYYRRAS